MAVTVIGYFFSYLTDKHQLNTLVRFSLDFKGYYHCHYLSSSHRRLLNLPSMRCTTHCWQSIGLALIGQAGKNTLYIPHLYPYIIRMFLMSTTCATCLTHFMLDG